jgi:hypothetical protein
MGSESKAVFELKALADQLDRLNERLERENAKMRAAIVLLTDVVDEILPYVVTDTDVIDRAKAANHAARATVTAMEE